MRVLITGMSGTGKSSTIEMLAARGYRSIDLDQPGWSVHAEDGDWIWNEGPVQSLLQHAGDDPLFISGCAENQGQFYRDLERVILLSAPVEVIRQRLRTRRNNPYGKSPEELDLVLFYIETVEPLIRRGATHEIDTDRPLTDVVSEILEIAEVGDQG
jgi:broad-specificity NMP kinase